MTEQFLRALFANAQGRAHILSLMADAEDTDEGPIFDRLAAHCDDDQLRGLIRRHQADEKRHASMFRECLALGDVTPGPVPSHLRLLDRLDRALGGVMQKPIRERRELMDAFLLLQVIEERASTTFPAYARAVRPLEPRIAETIEAVARDEIRHLKYCHALARRYAPDTASHAISLHRFRHIEARVFAENARANLEYVLSKGWIDLGLGKRWALRVVAALGELLGRPDRTPFWGQSPALS